MLLTSCLGVVGVFLTPWGLKMAGIEAPPTPGPMVIVTGVDGILTLVLGAMLLTGGIALLRRRESGIRQMEESFRRMRTDRMDLMQVHNLQDWRTHAETLDRWKADSRIRYTGITHYHEGAYGELEKVLRARRWDFVQLNYSLAEPAAAERMLPLAAELGVAVIANRPFAQGTLFSRVKGKALPGWAADIDCTSWAQVFLKWIVSHPAVNCAIPASSKTAHTVQNMLAGTGRMPDAALRARIAKDFDAL